MSKKKSYIYELVTIDKVVNNVVQESIPLNYANDDPIRAGRYKKAAEAGDTEAQKKLDEMINTPMINIIERG